jgi:hypothetical protein
MRLKINKNYIDIENEKQLFCLCIGFMLDIRYQYSPVEVLKEIGNSICELLEEGYMQLLILDLIDKKKYNAINKKTNIFREGLDYQNDRIKMIAYLFEQILRVEGSGTLHGFGFCSKFGDRLVGDAEKQSAKK